MLRPSCNRTERFGPAATAMNIPPPGVEGSFGGATAGDPRGSLTDRAPEAGGDSETPVAISLGSNLEPRLARLQAGLDGLRGIVEDVEVSRVYETDPVGRTDQPRFLNACLVGRSALDPASLLRALKTIERTAGRMPRGARWGPRELDLDLLLYGDRVVRTRTLRVPHPRLHERAFALVPLAELVPSWVHPVLGRTVGQLAAEVGRGGVRVTNLQAVAPGSGSGS